MVDTECRSGQLHSQNPLSSVVWPASARRHPNRKVHCSQRLNLLQDLRHYSPFSPLSFPPHPNLNHFNLSSAPCCFRKVITKPIRKSAAPMLLHKGSNLWRDTEKTRCFPFLFQNTKGREHVFQRGRTFWDSGTEQRHRPLLQGTTPCQGRAKK